VASTYKRPLFTKSLLSKCSTSCRASSLKLLVSNSLQVSRHFFFSFSEECTCGVCNRPHLSSLRLASHVDYSPVAPTAPSLNPHVSSGSVIRCEPVQLYHRHPLSRVSLAILYHITFLGDYIVWTLPGGLAYGRYLLRVGWAIEPYFVILIVSRAAGQSVVTSFLSVTDRLQVLADIIVDVV
jgi:hypothetical protein